MEEMSATIVPLGSLALIFAVISILVFLRKASIARQADESIKNRMEAKRNEKTESLEEQKKRSFLADFEVGSQCRPELSEGSLRACPRRGALGPWALPGVWGRSPQVAGGWAQPPPGTPLLRLGRGYHPYPNPIPIYKSVPFSTNEYQLGVISTNRYQRLLIITTNSYQLLQTSTNCY